MSHEFDFVNILKKFKSEGDSNWQEQAKWRIDNRYWLTKARRIALKIISTLREKNTDVEELSFLTNIPLETINKIVKGSYDIKLSEMISIEKVLQIKFDL